MKKSLALGVLVTVLFSTACRTKSELRREQELEKLKTEFKEARDVKADVETTMEELRGEVARLSGLTEQQASQMNELTEDLKAQIATLSARLQSLEQKSANVAQNPPAEAERTVAAEKKPSFEAGKALYDDGKFESAIEVLRAVIGNPANPEEARKSQYLLGDACFGAKDYGSAALEFAEFRKAYPKDNLVPSAIYKQATAFKNMGKKQEAKLFYQDVVDRYPASPFAARAKADIKRIK